MANNRGRIIDTPKTTPMVTGKIQQPRLNQNFGAEQRALKGFSEFIERKEEGERLGKENFKSSFVQEYERVNYTFRQGMVNDKELYKDGTSNEATQAQLNKMRDDFSKTGKQFGISQEEIDAIFFKVDKYDIDRNTDFQSRNIKYNDNLQKENFLAITAEGFNNQESGARLGEREESKKEFKESIKNADPLIKRGLITEEDTIRQGIKQRNKLIGSNVDYLLENNLVQLEELEAMTFEEFVEENQDMVFNVGERIVELNPTDFEDYQKAVKAAGERKKRRTKAQEDELKRKVEQETRKREDNPVFYASGDLGLKPEQEYKENLIPMVLGAAKNKYGIEFESLEDMTDKGYAPVTVDSHNSKSEIYDNFEVDIQEVMQVRGTEARGYTDGYEENIQESITNNQYNDSKLPLGYASLTAYEKGGEYNKFLNGLYKKENRQALEALKGMKGNPTVDFAIYEYKRQYKSDLGVGNPKLWETTESVGLGGVLQVFEEQGNLGNLNAKATTEDLKKVMSDSIKVGIMEETGGKVTEDIADFLDKENLEGTFISDLSPAQQTKVMEFYAVDDDFMDKQEKRLEKPIKEILGENKAISTGYGMALVKGSVDSETLSDAVRLEISSKNFTNEQGFIVPNKQIKIRSVPSEDKIVYTYNGEILYIDGEIAVLNYKSLKGE